MKFLLISLFLISGCETFNQSFGLARRKPDSFSIPENESLTIPPDFLLHPPLEPENKATHNTLAPSEARLLKKAGHTDHIEQEEECSRILKQSKRQKEMVGFIPNELQNDR